jgi:alkylation response protein AidB-like acyl-CoA dehydrogenase
MDFALHYTEEQELFRQDVRAWLEENIPGNMKRPIDGDDVTTEMRQFWMEKHRDMAKKGWLFPTYPKEYGGGGLTADHETILDEEFGRARYPRAYSNTYAFGSLIVWGTEEQKQKFLVPLLKGEKTAWQRLTEPQGGADLANVTSRAVRDGDDWIVNGQNIFISCHGDEDYFPGVLLTDPEAPRHRNLGFFMVPNHVPGLEIRKMNLLNGHGQNVIFMDNVRVPGDHLIGGDHQGWQVMQTLLEAEHGGRGRAFPRNEVLDNLMGFVKKTQSNGSTLGSAPLIQQASMGAYIDAHINGLLLKRTYWMYQNHMEMKGESNAANVFDRLSDLRIAMTVREIMGIYAFLGTKEPGAPHGGAEEVNQRAKAGQRHLGGSNNIAKVILARRIGISRTQERAAPTASTATPHGS